MKKTVLFLVILALIFSLTGCALIKNSLGPASGTSANTNNDNKNTTTKNGNIPDNPLNKNWVDNEYTQQLPKPDFNIFSAVEAENAYNITFSGVTIEKLRIYAEKLKTAGFTNNLTVQDESIMGFSVYNFSAGNTAGYIVNLVFSSGIANLSISKA